MKTIMNDTQIKTLEQVRQFLNGVEAIDLVIETKEARYAWIRETLIRFRYRQLGKADKGLLLDFLHKASGYSRIQVKRLVKQYLKTGKLQRRQRTVKGFYSCTATACQQSEPVAASASKSNGQYGT